MIIATAGHVDHGKTSLVNALTGVDTDRLAEEKQRGLTIDLGFAYTDAETGHRLGFVDVPGHIRFINNMLAGVSAIDYALLVIAADDGVMPQTIEHLDILKLLGIRTGAIAVTKIDRCDEAQIEHTLAQIRELVENTFLADADVYPVSSVTGEGMETLQLALDIAADEVVVRSDQGLFRLAIDRRFTVKGSGIVVTGSVFAGSVTTGEELLLMPQGLPVRVRGLHTQNQEAETASTGDRCAVNLTGAGLELEDIHRGNWLTGNTAASTNRVDARLTVLDTAVRPLAHWTPVHIHTAANHMTGRVAVLEEGRIPPGASGLVQLVFEPAINTCIGDRFVIRDQAALHTIGGGEVLDPWSPKRGRAKPARIDYLNQVVPASAEATLSNLLQTSELGLDLERFRQGFNLSTDEVALLLNELQPVLLPGDYVITANHLASNRQEASSLLDNWHESNPGKAGLPLNQIQSLLRRWPSALLDRVIEDMVADGDLLKDGNLLKRPGFGVQLTQKEQAIWGKALPVLSEDPVKPPVLHDLAKSLSVPPKEMEKILNQVAKTGQVVKPVKNRFFIPEGIEHLKSSLGEAADEKGQFTVQQYRDVTGIGRNLCIEILEYFDRQGVTRRIGDTRQIMEQ